MGAWRVPAPCALVQGPSDTVIRGPHAIEYAGGINDRLPALAADQFAVVRA
jgi:hypothetical protein